LTYSERLFQNDEPEYKFPDLVRWPGASTTRAPVIFREKLHKLYTCNTTLILPML